MMPWIALHGSPWACWFKQGEHVVQTLHLHLRLLAMILERLLEFGTLCRLRHLGQRLQDLVLSEIDVLQRVQKKTLQVLLGHEHSPVACLR